VNGTAEIISAISTTTKTLSADTTAQAILNTSANGAVDAAANTFYEFECYFELSAMSAVSGNFSFKIGGTAGIEFINQVAEARKTALASLATPGTPQSARSTSILIACTSNNTSTSGYAVITGRFKTTTAGTIIPEVVLSQAAAAVVEIGAHFHLFDLSTTNPAGAWT